MPSKIFVNLPVTDLTRSIRFFEALGWSFDRRFTDERAGCLVIGDDIFVMLLTEPFFASFTKKSIADTSDSTEAIIALSEDTRDEVDRIADAALAAGAVEAQQTQETSPMYTRSFYDLDGHHWEIFWMDPASVPA
ncbi:VOC family protein [Actinacidiphila acididurans]|uniref:Glyoxalase/bleomycin resistance/extradiol dioxygenase family protein n=1 Tax=Actinacidiphila acididurans TaxID=2784346 RepID=A0ABS2TSQ2_9ACTN|nr:VOC family protein [Actinacidiphila acididurans]MBM9506369.1 glyoxalase/bleomycin resistance/extradiol dioxygenase family protein [Actinacidiphila acididurans]